MAKIFWLYLAIVLLSKFMGRSVKSFDSSPTFPAQFSATVVTIAHMVNSSNAYPPSLRKIRVHYDSVKGRAKAEILEGYDVGKTFIRRYDLKKEYMVQKGKHKRCHRGYLGEAFPEAVFPDNAQLQDQIIKIERYTEVNLHVKRKKNRGILCQHWIKDEDAPGGIARIHIYTSRETGFPVKLVEEFIPDIRKTQDKKEIVEPVMSYFFENFSTGEQDTSVFSLPKPYSDRKCERNIQGFPYFHIFSWYIRL